VNIFCASTKIYDLSKPPNLGAEMARGGRERGLDGDKGNKGGSHRADLWICSSIMKVYEALSFPSDMRLLLVEVGKPAPSSPRGFEPLNDTYPTPSDLVFFSFCVSCVHTIHTLMGEPDENNIYMATRMGKERCYVIYIVLRSAGCFTDTKQCVPSERKRKARRSSCSVIYELRCLLAGDARVLMTQSNSFVHIVGTRMRNNETLT